jgi:hypothetical protein
MIKKRGLFRQGFWFGMGFTVAAYITMFIFDTLSSIINFFSAAVMSSLPGV